MKQNNDESRALLQLAEQDWEIMQAIKDAPRVHLAGVCFHAQQCVEKSLKAVLIMHDLKYPLTHNLELLADKLLGQGVSIPVDADVLSLLNPCAVAYRYDNQEITYMAKEDVLNVASTMLTWAQAETGMASA
ncbi:MAG: HEPN domain-containing protein [Betaproteobacteria bacterium]|nr:HEPN domain-containing protein [Betaproteobacteria bacterium]